MLYLQNLGDFFLNDFKWRHNHFDFAINIGYLYVGSSNFTILLKSF